MISANKLTLRTVTTKNISENTQLQIFIIGARNPTYTGSTLPNDFNMTITIPAGNRVNIGSFSPIVFLPAQPVQILYMKIA